MPRKSVVLSMIIIFTLFFSGIVAVVRASPLSQPDFIHLSALTGYTYQANLEIRNNATTSLPAGYTVTFNLNTAALIGQSRLQADCDDLRITFNNGSEVELDRLVTGCNTISSQVQFRTQAAIAASPATDTRYTLYYGNLTAITPPQNKANVFAFFDDFQDADAIGWSAVRGNWGVVNDAGNYVYRYTDGGSGWALTTANMQASDIDYLAKIRAVDVPMTNWIGLAFRIQDPNNFLTIYQSRDTNQFKYARIVNNNHSIQFSPGFSMSANNWHWIRLQALGNQVRARIWLDGSAEPTSWLITATDATYQTSTNIGLTLNNHTTSADWDEVSVRHLAATEPSVSLGATSWWDNSWGYRRQITVTNTSSTTALPTRYTASLTLDTAALIGSGQMMANCDDLRLVYDPGLAATPIDRVIENCNSSQTTVWFALQRPVSPSGQDTAHYLYYGNSLAAAPPANGMNVFLFLEDWEQGSSHWTNAGGLDAGNTGTLGTTQVSTDVAYSPTHSQKFTSKAGGGDAFSGYIPVLPNTAYTFGVLGSTPSSLVCTPVGFDPYTAAYAKGLETWFWTNLWPTSSTWNYRTYGFTTATTTAYIKLKSELWNDSVGCGGSGNPPVYLDNLALRYSIGSEPTQALGAEEGGTLPAPTITSITATSPINLGNPAVISAVIATSEGTITSATLKIITPQTADVPMSLLAGTNTNGTWQATSFTPAIGGIYTFRILAEASTGRSRLSEQHTFTVSDTTPPNITPVSKIDPVLIRNTQTVVVRVSDNGLMNSVNITVGGTSHLMTANGNQYSYSWLVTTVGTIPYTVTATDSSNNTATLDGTFVSQAQNVEVCTWSGCRQGAASWSIDDGNNSCRAELENAGIRGTYFYSGNSTPSWFSDYSAAGHEIASHTVGHPCNTPSCSPTCTAESLAAIPIDPAVVTAYRQGQIEPNIAAIEAGTLKPVVSLAWPCGCTDPSRMQAASYSVVGARGYYDYVAQLTWVEGINNITPANWMLLNTAASYRQDFIDQAYAEGKWATVTSHGSCAGIDYMGAQSSNGHLWVAPIGDVLKYIKVRDASQLSGYSRVGRTITFDALHNLPSFTRQKVDGSFFNPIIYDNKVTLKAHILDNDTVLDVKVENVSVPYTIQNLDGTRYVTFDAALNTSRHVIVTLGALPPVINSVTVNTPIELGNSVTVNANVTVSEGTIQSVILHVASPETHDYPMSTVSGNQYSATFNPTVIGAYNYRVVATNVEGTSSQSAQDTFNVQDTTPPATQSQIQSTNNISMNSPVTISAQGRDIGGLVRAVLSTDESGTWQDFDWPVTDWWNHNWAKRRMITITENSGFARTNEIVDLAISSATFNGLNSCVNEFRVADATKVEIPSQVYGELVDGGGIRTCHLLFPASVGANTSRNYFIYYGNPSATAPTYITDLTTSATGNLRTIQNTSFDLDLDIVYGIISRMRLYQGNNSNLPLSTSANYYWGWHQVCSSLDGNITGKNNLCQNVTQAPDASGLSVVETINGPLLREFTFTSVKTNATYTITFRFYAYAPYYHYSLARTGSTSAVMNNFWYLDGNITRLEVNTGGTPSSIYNTYDYTADHIRISSFETIDHASIDGTNNDGTDLGALDYRYPSATGLNLSVVTGSDQTEAQRVLSKISSPLDMATPGSEENAPIGNYGSPIELVPGADWTTTSFIWQHPSINNQYIHWRIKFCDVSSNCIYTPEKVFAVGTPTSANLNYFRAGKTSDGVQLSWETVSEATTAGFNLYRREADGDFILINESLIPPQAAGQPMGSAYTYLDTGAEPGQLYEYKLEVIETNLQVADSVLVTYWPYTVTFPLVMR